MTNTNTAAAGACLVWVLTDAIRGTISISGACSGLIVGLVASKLFFFCLGNTRTERVFRLSNSVSDLIISDRNSTEIIWTELVSRFSHTCCRFCPARLWPSHWLCRLNNCLLVVKVEIALLTRRRHAGHILVPRYWRYSSVLFAQVSSARSMSTHKAPTELFLVIPCNYGNRLPAFLS